MTVRSDFRPKGHRKIARMGRKGRKNTMKKLNKVLVLALAVIMTLAMSASVFAQDAAYTGTDKGSATITITNAANGETYKVYKLFDATVSATQTQGVSDSIAYTTGTIPSSLATYFTKDGKGNITATDAAKDPSDPTKLSSAAVEALKAWANSDAVKDTYLISAESDGTPLTFKDLPYGFYVITSTQNSGAAITVDSTNPNATVNDKNTTPPVKNPTKTVDDDDVFIGQTVTYTVKFGTANFDGTKKIISYTIKDTPATGSLENINVTSIIVDEDGDTTTTDDQTTLTTQQFTNNEITIPWASGSAAAGYTSLYKNGATLIITYTAKVAAAAAVDGNGNTNEVEISHKTDDNQNHPYEDKITETIYTYALAIKKVDQAGKNLAGATFELPFYVEETKASDGAYVYAGTTAGDGLTNSLTTPDDGLIIIKGVQSGTYEFTETDAPAGYNKLTAPVSVTAVKTGQTTTSTTTYLDAEGNIVDTESEATSTVTVTISQLSATPVVVVNKTGTELPATGGIGTTIFYILGSLLVVGCGIVLVSRKRMQNNK